MSEGANRNSIRASGVTSAGVFCSAHCPRKRAKSNTSATSRQLKLRLRLRNRPTSVEFQSAQADFARVAATSVARCGRRPHNEIALILASQFWLTCGGAAVSPRSTHRSHILRFATGKPCADLTSMIPLDIINLMDIKLIAGEYDDRIEAR